MRPLQVRARLDTAEPAGAYHRMVLRAPGVPERSRPGQFVTLGVGDSGLLLRRAFAIGRTGRDTDTVELIVAVHGPGTAWLVAQPVGTVLDLVGPLGTAFPVRPGPAVLVGGGYGGVPLVTLADLLDDPHLVLGAATADRLYGRDLVRHRLTVTTEDGSAGVRGLVTDVLDGLVTAGTTVYACGPMGMLRAVAAKAAGAGAACHVSVEEAMACGVGVCMTCVLPVVGADGSTRMTRTCVDGPVIEASRVRFADVGTVPDECVGAAAMGAH